MEKNKEKSASGNVQVLKQVSSEHSLSEEEWKERMSSDESYTTTLEAKKAGFVGELTVQYGWKNNGTTLELSTLQYRIAQPSGKEWGNKANVNILLMGGNFWADESPDSMWQDGDWHSYYRRGEVLAYQQAVLLVTFIFDKSGQDETGYAVTILRNPSGANN